MLATGVLPCAECVERHLQLVKGKLMLLYQGSGLIQGHLHACMTDRQLVNPHSREG